MTAMLSLSSLKAILNTLHLSTTSVLLCYQLVNLTHSNVSWRRFYSPSPPLCLAEFAALIRLNSAQHVKQILLPASLFIPIPGLEDDRRTPVRLVDSSVADFFLDRMRSQQYYVDDSRAHAMLLEACNWVMQRVYADQGRYIREDWGWKGAYEYACRNWERHRRCIRVKAKL